MVRKYYEYKQDAVTLALWTTENEDDPTNNSIVLGLVLDSDVLWRTILLTEQEQDALIVGILERRGINPHNTLGVGGYIDKMDITGTSIEAGNEVQSLIHPAKIS